jgi:rhodanese-related sulfurtransferase
MKTPELKPARGPEFGLQMGFIFAAAMALGVAYNDVSPLGVRAARREGTASPQTIALATRSAGTPSAMPAPLLPTVARTGDVNQTVSMNLEMSGTSPGTPLTASAVDPAPASTPPAMQFSELTWGQVKPLVAAGKVVLLDARLKANYELSHIPGAISFPFTSPAVDVQLFALKYPKQTQFVVYCGSEQCHMSHQMAEVLFKICGYTNVSEMPGGYAEYLAAEPAGAPAEAR